MDPLKLLLKTLGISVEHLVEGLRKCVNELGPEASEAVKKLLVTIGCGLICQWAELSHRNAPPHSHSPCAHLWTCISPDVLKVCMSRNLKEGATFTFLEGIFEWRRPVLWLWLCISQLSDSSWDLTTLGLHFHISKIWLNRLVTILGNMLSTCKPLCFYSCPSAFQEALSHLVWCQHKTAVEGKGNGAFLLWARTHSILRCNDPWKERIKQWIDFILSCVCFWELCSEEPS